jgi:hypothetical protein
MLTQLVEALSQEIEDVRKELFGSPVSKKRQESSTNGDSSTGPPAKRQRLVSSTKEAAETRSPEHQETVDTHGELVRPLHNLIDDVRDHFSDFQMPGNIERSFDSICDQHTTIFDFPNPPERDRWEFPRSVFDEFARNDPSLFAKASSTIPDNTLDQQHMIDEILAENHPVPASAMQINSESSSSIPWSTYITMRNQESQASSDPSDSVRDLEQSMTRKSAKTHRDSNSDPAVTSNTPKGSPTQRGFFVDEAAPISNRKKNSKKHKRKETSLEDDDQNDQPFEKQQNSSSTPTQSHMTSGNGDGSIQVKGVPEEPHIVKKRGRGRPRKYPKPTEDAGRQDQVSLKVESVASSEDKNSPGVAEPLKELDANPKTSASDLASPEDIKAVTKHDGTPVEPAKILLIPTEPSEDLIEEPKREPANKAPNSESSILKGKVPYRVGLSKKARITPLLNIMKK